MKVVIEPTKEDAGDIFFPGNLVVLDETLVVLVQDGYAKNGDCFVGTALNLDDMTWSCDNNWQKKHFHQFHGKVTLEA